jgi:hypothetical protein
VYTFASHDKASSEAKSDFERQKASEWMLVKILRCMNFKLLQFMVGFLKQRDSMPHVGTANGANTGGLIVKV